MRPASVVIDVAAETGGNCELTEPGEVAVRHQVTIAGPLNLADQQNCLVARHVGLRRQAGLPQLVGTFGLDRSDGCWSGAVQQVSNLKSCRHTTCGVSA
jgi:hypothetical protein